MMHIDRHLQGVVDQFGKRTDLADCVDPPVEAVDEKPACLHKYLRSLEPLDPPEELGEDEDEDEEEDENDNSCNLQ